ncbi:MAG: hypothetical protein JNM82_04585 [Rhodocyclaceae bacterium]|nr:hypothetical protein [Rhodocyclaceae bacterium]
MIMPFETSTGSTCLPRCGPLPGRPHAARRRAPATGLAARIALALLVGAIAAGVLLPWRGTPGPASGHPALAGLPPTLLWAWERPEDLRWLPADTGVAFVAVTLELEGDTVRRRRRGHALHVVADTARIPVVHVDASWRRPPRLGEAQREAIVAALLAAAEQGNRKVVQLDFEARRSQRAFLADVVREARARLPADTALSMTALASWCAGTTGSPACRRTR